MTDATTNWAATHRAPREGMDAWSTPDPADQPASELDGGVAVQLIATAGEWANVRGNNGWEGWVDGKLLEQFDPTDAPGDRRAYVLLAAAIAVLIVLAVMGMTG